MTQIEQIKAEIERRKEFFDGRILTKLTKEELVLNELDELLSFLDTLEQSPQGLDEASFDTLFDKFCDQHPEGLTLEECGKFFYEQGKKWMAGQIRKKED